MAVGRWHWNDAWLFVAVVIADRTERDRSATLGLPSTGASLADVLSAADFLHNAVPTREEVETAVRRLAGAGLVNVDDDVFEVAAAGEHLWRTRPFSGLSSAVDSLQSVLNRSSCAPGALPWTLADAAYGAAVRQYCSWVAEGN